MDPWYLENLVCPVEKTPLTPRDGRLVSQGGREYPVVDGVPVMLVKDADQTISVASSSLARAEDPSAADPRAPEFYLESLFITDAEKERVLELARKSDGGTDPVVAYLLNTTSGYTYRHLLGKVREYPIPQLRLPDGNGTPLLDVGCNWGRWSIAAARKGYAVTGVDPSLGGVMAARRVANQLGVSNRYLVADARYLPFKDAAFGVVFSYSVLQHLSKDNARTAMAEVGRVLRPGGHSLIQMPNWLGVRCLYHQLRRRFREPRGFEVRYWGVGEMKRSLEAAVGPSTTSVDCYFGLGLQHSDRHLMPPMIRMAMSTSERLRAVSRKVGAIKYVADSLYVHSSKPVRP